MSSASTPSMIRTGILKASTITVEMEMAAVHAIAELAQAEFGPLKAKADALEKKLELLVLPPDQVVVQRYGADSAQRHADAGLVELPDVPRRVRHDVDTVADLLVALRMGPGAATARACADLGLDRYGQREAG